MFEESLLVQAIRDTEYSGVEVFVPNSHLISAHARMQELGIPDAQQSAIIVRRPVGRDITNEKIDCRQLSYVTRTVYEAIG